MRTLVSNVKTGMASIFVVIFTTLLIGIITLSFVQIMLSEANQTTNSNLSQSAYESALAGIEDAKIALLLYQECISKGDRGGAGGTDACERAVSAMETYGKGGVDAPEGCDAVSKALGRWSSRGSEEEIFIQSEYDAGADSTIAQAYTCVLVSEENADYVSEVRGDYHTKLVPLRVGDVDNLNKVRYIKFQWFSNADIDGTKPFPKQPTPAPTGLQASTSADGVNKSPLSNSGSGLFAAPDLTNPFTPPAIALQLIQTATRFNLDSLDVNFGNTTTNSGLLFFVPTPQGTSGAVSNNAVLPSRALAASSDKASSSPVPINCNHNRNQSEFMCSVTIGMPDPNPYGTHTRRNESTAFLRVTLPYGMPNTSFSITLCETSDCNEPICHICHGNRNEYRSSPLRRNNLSFTQILH